MHDVKQVRHPMLILITVLSATFMQLVDISIVNTAIPSIQRDLDATFSSIQLVLAGYQLSFACMLITGARLGDIFGRKRLFLIGMVGFTAASIFCGLAQTPHQLIIARVLQGALSGLMFPQVLSVIQVIYPPQERGRVFGIYGATIGIATIAGPLLGGLFIAWNPAHTLWRSIFLVNVPIGLFAIVSAIRVMPESKAENASRLDVKGALLVASGLFLLIYPLSVGREKGWPTWSFLSLGLSVPVLVFFVWFEGLKTRRADSPLLLTTLFKERAFVVGLAISATFFLGVAPFFFIFSLTLQAGFGFTAIGAGLTTFPFALGSALAASQSDKIAQRIGLNLLRLGCALLVIGHGALLLSLHFAGTGVHGYQLAPALFICGIGLGCFVGPVNNVILARVRVEAAGSASGVISTSQLVAGAVGVAALGSIFFGLLGANANVAATKPTRQLNAALVSTGTPPGAADRATAAFALCFDRRAHAVDPSTAIAGCPNASATSPFSKAATYARKADFSRSMQQAILWELVVFAVALGLVGGLPPRPEHAAPQSAPAEA